MLIKKIKYVDFDGNQREEEFYFNLTKAEVVKWLTTSGDYTLDKALSRLIEKRNGKEIMNTIEDLVHRSYGQKSLDGRRFEKTDEIWKNFKETEAYSVFFMELVSDAKKAADFVNGILPKDMADSIAKIVEENPDAIPAEIMDYLKS